MGWIAGDTVFKITFVLLCIVEVHVAISAHDRFGVVVEGIGTVRADHDTAWDLSGLVVVEGSSR